jgi:hypothetical protein
LDSVTLTDIDFGREFRHAPHLRLCPGFHHGSDQNQIQEIEAAGFKVDPRRVVSETVSGSFMVGGMLSSTFLTLIVIPAIYAIVKVRATHPTKELAAGGIKQPAE